MGVEHNGGQRLVLYINTNTNSDSDTNRNTNGNTNRNTNGNTNRNTNGNTDIYSAPDAPANCNPDYNTYSITHRASRQPLDAHGRGDR